MRYERRLSKPCYFLLVVVLVVAASLPGLGDSPPRNAQAALQDFPLCMTNEFQILGQEWEVDGGAFGFSQGVPAGADVVDYVRLADQFTQMTLANSTSALAPNQPIVVLVVDDFDTLVRGASHGDYVYEVAYHTLTAARAKLGFPADLITLVRVNAPSYDVSKLIAAINDKLDAYIAPDKTRFVLNMSFVLMPCTYEVDGVTLDLPAFRESYDNRDEANYSLIQYVEGELNVEREEAHSVVYDWISAGSTLLDPLHTYLQDQLAEGVALVLVASAGNYGDLLPSSGSGSLDPFAPGSWEEVISVSSTRADYSQAAGDEFRELSVFTNAGGVSAPGEWHIIPSSSEYVAGTSFAAPVTSILVALMQSTWDTKCNFGPWEEEDLLNAYFVDAFSQGAGSVSAACTP